MLDFAGLDTVRSTNEVLDGVLFPLFVRSNAKCDVLLVIPLETVLARLGPKIPFAL